MGTVHDSSMLLDVLALVYGVLAAAAPLLQARGSSPGGRPPTSRWCG